MASAAAALSAADVLALVQAEEARMARADEDAAAAEEARIEAEFERTQAASQRAAEDGGLDPKTLAQIKYGARKFAAWLALHGAGHGYAEGDEVGEALLLKFSAYCFTHRTRSFSVYGDEVGEALLLKFSA